MYYLQLEMDVTEDCLFVSLDRILVVDSSLRFLVFDFDSESIFTSYLDYLHQIRCEEECNTPELYMSLISSLFSNLFAFFFFLILKLSGAHQGRQVFFLTLQFHKLEETRLQEV